jgi:hypothetical protein
MPTQATNTVSTEIDYSVFGGEGAETEPVAADEVDLNAPPVEEEQVDEQIESDATDDDIELDDELEAPAVDDPEFEIDDGIKLKKSEIRELHENKSNYSRYADELQVVETERATLKQQTEAFHGAIQQVQGEYDIALRFVQENLPKAPDVELLKTNPQLYIIQKEMRDQAIQKFHQMREELGKATEASKSNYQKTMTEQEQVRAETEAGKLLKAVPALKDEKKFHVYQQSIEAALGQYGFSKNEVARMILADHRVALIARKAALYDKGKTPKQSQPMTQQQQKTPKSIPAPSRIQGSSKNVTQRLQFTDTLKRVSSGKLNRSSAMDVLAQNFGD